MKVRRPLPLAPSPLKLVSAKATIRAEMFATLTVAVSSAAETSARPTDEETALAVASILPELSDDGWGFAGP